MGKKKYTIILLSIVLFLMNEVKSQDTLRLLNGNTLLVNIGEIKEYEISYIPFDAKNKSFSYREKANIFSFTKEGKSEVILYEYDPERRNFYQVDEMRQYMLGEQHADKYYKSHLNNILSSAAGVLGGYYLANDQFVALGTPILASSILMIPGAKVKRNELNGDFIDTDLPYRNGYRRVAKSKKFMQSLKYGALSMLGSFVFFKFIDE